MKIHELRKKYQLIDIFLELCAIPSPPLKEEAVARKIISVFKDNNICAEYDDYKNVIARIPGTGRYKNIQPLLLSAHMDVVGGSEKVNIKLSEDGDYIETDKTRTLGADNKAGVAAIIDLAIDLVNSKPKMEHCPIEITFTRDEEKGMTGVRNLDTASLKSKYAIIADGENMGELDCEGASFTNVFVKVYGGKGGHSGINIHEKDRINAVKVLSEFDSRIPQGVYKHDKERGVITSINAGVCVGGSADIYISEMIKDAYNLAGQNNPIPAEYFCSSIMDTISQSAVLNTITSDARISYSIRSSEPENEQELLDLIKKNADTLTRKYNGLIKVDVEIKQHLSPFVRNEDSFLSLVILKAGKTCDINCVPASFHAGAETHILSNEKENFYGEPFNPVIIGIANLMNIHSADEKIDWKSFLKGRKWLEEIVFQFAEDSVEK